MGEPFGLSSWREDGETGDSGRCRCRGSGKLEAASAELGRHAGELALSCFTSGRFWSLRARLLVTSHFCHRCSAWVAYVQTIGFQGRVYCVQQCSSQVLWSARSWSGDNAEPDPCLPPAVMEWDREANPTLRSQDSSIPDG